MAIEKRLTDKAFAKLAKANPARALVEARRIARKLESGYHEAIRSSVVGAYEAGLGFSKKPARLTRLLRKREFRTAGVGVPDVNEKAQVLRFVFDFVFDVDKKHGYDRAWKYRRGLERYFLDGVPASKVSALIRKLGGLEALYRAEVKNHPKRGSPVTGVEPRGGQAAGRTQPKQKESASNLMPRTIRVDDTILFLDVKPDECREALSMRIGEKAEIVIERAADRGGWQRYFIRSFNRRRSVAAPPFAPARPSLSATRPTAE